jgi:hypothetical protein
MQFEYPLHLKFRFFSLTPQVSVQNNSGSEVMFVRQKMFALREEVKVFSNSSKTQELYRIKAKQIIDFGAEYVITNSTSGKIIGSLKQQGLKTLWRATYYLKDTSGNDKYTIVERNPWVKVVDSLASQVPILSLFTGYMFHPEYDVKAVPGGEHVVTLVKKPSLFEKTFDIELVSDKLSKEDEELIASGLLMMVLQQKARG